jgi:DNA-binding response OmpR family regulator
MTPLELGRRTVLCVDSEARSRVELAAALTDYQVFFASNAFEALRQINTRGFHGYVLEYWLPDLAGPTLCREIRKLDPHAPIVFCTAAQRPSDRARALRAGAQAYLYKPVNAAELKARLEAYLSAADIESVRARVDEERAIHDELQRRITHARERAAQAALLATQSIERTARIRAMKAFIAAHGTRAHFEHWWPQVFHSTRAGIDVS